MLLAVSQTLQGFLHAVVPPPLAHTEQDQWVRIADLSSESASEHANRLALNLYAVEPDPYQMNRIMPSDGGRHRDAPLPLALHYLVTYYSDRHDQVQTVLSRVAQAFHSCPLIQVSQYLDPTDGSLDAAERASLPERIRVRLATPEGDKVSHLWSAMRQGRRLALYYRVEAALVPAFMPKLHAAVGAPVPPVPEFHR
jgi:Pvc16 N-terminal domain